VSSLRNDECIRMVSQAGAGRTRHLPVQNRMMSVRPRSSVLAQRPSMSSQNRRSLLRWSSRWTLRSQQLSKFSKNNYRN